MKKSILIFITWLMALGVIAQVQPTDTMYSVSLHVGYGHNLTYGSYANFDIDAYLPINRHFDMQANIRTTTANFYTVGVQLRPKFALPVGELYLEDRVMARWVVRDDINDFVHALSLGYMMQYVNVQVGMSTRIIIPQPYTFHTDDELIVEPFNVIYRVEAFVRPQTSPWNISLCVANIDNYQVERVWQPMFYLGGWYDINNNWRVRLSGKYKLAGMFHLNAHYYGAEVRAGVEYRF